MTTLSQLWSSKGGSQQQGRRENRRREIELVRLGQISTPSNQDRTAALALSGTGRDEAVSRAARQSTDLPKARRDANVPVATSGRSWSNLAYSVSASLPAAEGASVIR